MIRHRKGEAFTEELIAEYIREASAEKQRKQRLFDMYLGKSSPDKGHIAEGRPNNRAYTNFAKYITDTAAAYFAGVSPRYVFEDRNEAELFNRIFDRNDETQLNYSIAEGMGICGAAYDIVYLDEKSNIRIALIDPRELTPVYEDCIETALAAAIRDFAVYKKGTLKRFGELYTKDELISFEIDGGKVRFTAREENLAGVLPISEYRNNAFGLGDFEACTENIELYNLLLSNASDDLQSIANAYLAISGMLGTTKEDIERMNETRIALLSDDGKMEFITKNLDASAVENHKRSLRQDILQVAGIPDLSDERFYSGLSGAAMEYRLWALDQLRSKKQAGMDKGLFNRLKVISRFLDLKFMCKEGIENRTTIIYSRNMPKDAAGIAEAAVKIRDIVSKETVLTLLEPLTKIRSEDEKERIEKEAADCTANRADTI